MPAAASRRVGDRAAGTVTVAGADPFAPIGIDADKDRARGVRAADAAPSCPIATRGMSADVAFHRDRDDLPGAARHSAVHGVRRRPVRDARGHVAGVLPSDLVRASAAAAR